LVIRKPYFTLVVAKTSKNCSPVAKHNLFYISLRYSTYAIG